MNDKTSMTKDDIVEQALTDSLFKNAGLSNSLQMVLALIVFFILKNDVHYTHLLTWFSTLVFITIGRTIFVSIYWEKQRQTRPAGYSLKAYLFLLYLNAATWGLLIFIPMTSVKTGLLAFICFVIAGLSAGALMSLSALLRAAVPYLLFVLTPLLVFFILQKEPRYIAMAAMIALYLFLLIRTAKEIHRMLTDALAVDAQNDELYLFLKKAREKLDDKIQHYNEALDRLDEATRLRNNFFEHIDIPLCIMDAKANIVEANDAFFKFTGSQHSDTGTKSLSDLIHENETKKFEQQIFHTVEDRIATSSTYQIRNAVNHYENVEIKLNYADGLVNAIIMRTQ